jgi:hypothetical protein
MVNEHFEVSPDCDQILDVFKAGRDRAQREEFAAVCRELSDTLEKMADDPDETEPAEIAQSVATDLYEAADSVETPGEPWGYATPRHLMDETGMDKPNVEYYLRRLHDAGWIEKPSRGLYRFVEDPRED